MKSKDEIRKYIWNLLEEKGVALFPKPIVGRIPNFVGANVAAEKLNEMSIWRKARLVKSNPDSPQKWVRENALKHGKTVFMAVPRLRELKCFIKIEPKSIINIKEAATIKGAFKYGKPVYPEEIDHIDVVVAGCVAVNYKGAKLGKGGGFSDLEYSIGRKFGFVSDETPILTTVHPLQIIQEDIPMLEHDVPLDYFITRNGVQAIDKYFAKPDKIHWNILGEKLKEIPILQKMQRK
ncbi:MAG: 5-formyltetrahydrofolate cyclo-ligase [Candidatus Thermoplasmatota archaeon]|nr:5-formyltetrahydrofolate cyclo-ligase [Candidatus Thermoplasmatota archaeon]